ncbi:bifunctional 2-C-methyl-D-erythritol 4-phosphate cytidylyltransferase/2-C-methyl-D-erythritol 2,4-cyclodiphosphate synthase [Brevirhabdus sp.]|uniref:bifunctional 2-C-methyl-D-erythritol 4-phosphate cytidylyltransferase/2-C-methyl-D-erythritol 2,4-cyclodiphosphate synthase n=1 Tax=Brevirhabdus sp. TaxID=2004514 RepID=UPI0040589B36
MSFTAIIVAAGRGTRAGGSLPKQYRMLAGRTVLARTIDLFARNDAVRQIVVVIHPGDRALFDRLVRPALPVDPGRDITVVTGGETRALSVRAGLHASTGTRVLIHDAARPLCPEAVIGRVAAALDHAPGAAPGLPVTDALWRGSAERVAQIQPREGLFRAQTPQGFDRRALLRAYDSAPADAADDVAIARAAGLDVRIVEGAEDNLKITGPEDFARAEKLLRGAQVDIRVGNGFDVHRFGPGDAVMLCGVAVPHARGLQGHSDADVGMHAVTDAIYGALGQGDIGRHFPPSDPQWKGAASEIFLRHAVSLVTAQGFTLGNADCTLICEAPKIAPHAEAMRRKMAELMNITPDRVSVKATTSERLGFTGREEGIAALATVALVQA